MDNAYKVVSDFEEAVAKYTCAPYAVSVSSCTNALLLCCILEKVEMIKTVEIPKFTYPGVPCSIINAGGRVSFRDEDWQERGWYDLNGTNIIDSAKYLAEGMYRAGSLMCLSFHIRKTLPIGRGGIILTDSDYARHTLKLLRFDGRHECALAGDDLKGIGFNCYMTPAQAARGLELMQGLKKEQILAPDPYQNLSKYDFYKNANRGNNRKEKQ